MRASSGTRPPAASPLRMQDWHALGSCAPAVAGVLGRFLHAGERADAGRAWDRGPLSAGDQRRGGESLSMPASASVLPGFLATRLTLCCCAPAFALPIVAACWRREMGQAAGRDERPCVVHLGNGPCRAWLLGGCLGHSSNSQEAGYRIKWRADTLTDYAQRLKLCTASQKVSPLNKPRPRTWRPLTVGRCPVPARDASSVPGRAAAGQRARPGRPRGCRTPCI